MFQLCDRVKKAPPHAIRPTRPNLTRHSTDAAGASSSATTGSPNDTMVDPTKPPGTPLPVSEPQLFDIMQTKRRAIVEWLEKREKGEDARKVQHLLHEVFESGTGDLNHFLVHA